MQWASQFVVGRSDMFTQYFKTTFTVYRRTGLDRYRCSMLIRAHHTPPCLGKVEEDRRNRPSASGLLAVLPVPMKSATFTAMVDEQRYFRALIQAR